MLKSVEFEYEGIKLKITSDICDAFKVLKHKDGSISVKIVPKASDTETIKVPVFPGFRRVYDIDPNEFMIKNEKDASYFTWVPVSEKIIKGGFGRLNIDNSDLSHFNEDITAELRKIFNFIEKYKGFYKATYPASMSMKGNLTLPAFVPNADIWTDIDFCTVEKLIDSYNSNMLESGLRVSVTYGMLYDYVCQSIIDRGIKTYNELVIDSSDFGNYRDNDEPVLLKTGEKSEYMVAGLYGIAGGVFEMTHERAFKNVVVCRGGAYDEFGDDFPAYARSINLYGNEHGEKAKNVGFGAILYGRADVCYETFEW